MIRPGDVLFAWDASHGIVPTVGGDPSFSRGGDKWTRMRAAGGGPLYQKRVESELPFAWVERDGVLLPRRALDLESGESYENDSSAVFDGSGSWFRSVAAEEAAATIFADPPSGVGARAIQPGGTGGLWQPNMGTYTGNSETLSAIFERVPLTRWDHNPMESLRLAFYDETAGAFHSRVEYNLSIGTVTVISGTPEEARMHKLAESGPNGGTVWRCVLTDTGVAGRGRRIYAPRIDDETGEWYLIHHAQHEVRHAETSPAVYTGSPASRPHEILSFPIDWHPTDFAFYFQMVEGGSIAGNPTPRERGVWNIGTGSASGSTTVQVRGSGDPGGTKRYTYQLNDDGNNWHSLELAAPSTPVLRSLVEIAGFLDVTNQQMAYGVRVDRSAFDDAGPNVTGTISSSWTSPALRLAQAFGTTRGREKFLRLLFVRLGPLDAPTDGSDNEALMDELADVPIGPQIAGHPQ